MAEVPVEAIRQSNRYELTINRKKLKHEENDIRRSLANLTLESVDLSALANKLKTKSEVTVGDLQMLKNILIQDEKNIRLVLNTQGALRGLVREISGNDVNRQVEAAACLCNLALADLRGCLTIIRVAGAYLVAALDSQNLELAIRCAWTLGNLCGAGLQASKLMTTTGAVYKLCGMLRGGAQPERMDAAVAALTLFAHAMGDELSVEHLNMMVKWCARATWRGTADLRLYYILSCHKDYSDPHQLVQNQLIQRFPDIMRQHHSMCVGAQCCELVYGIRTLANMETGSVYYNFLVHIQADDTRRRDFLDLVKDPRLKISMLWLYGNMGWKQDHDYFIKHFDFNTYRPERAVNEENPEGQVAIRLERFADMEPDLGAASDEDD